MVVTSASIPSLGRWKQEDRKGKVILGYTFMWLEFPGAIIIIMIHLTLPLGLLQVPPGLGVRVHFHLVQAYSPDGTRTLGGSHMLDTVLCYVKPLQD